MPIIYLPLFSIFGVKVIRVFFLRKERGQEWQETLVRSTIDRHIIVCGLSLASLHAEEDLMVLLHAGNGRIDIPPNLYIQLQTGDEIVVLATEEKLSRLNRRNEESVLSE